jgi:hypothetical protein
LLNGNSKANLMSVPSLDQVVSDPSSLQGLDARTLSALVLRAHAAAGIAAAQLSIVIAAEPHLETPVREKVSRKSKNETNQPARQGGRTLSIEQACELLHKPRKWLFRNSSRLPFVHRISRKHLVCDENGLRQWLIAHADHLTA